MQSSAQFETITPNKAKAFLEKNKSNRPINKFNLGRIELEMKRNNFELTGESIKFAEDGTLLDGQHRLLAIVNTGKEQKMLVVRGLENEAFKYIDTGRVRTAGDVLGIMGIANSTRYASMAKFIINFKKSLFTSVAQSSAKKRNSLVTNADVADFVSKNIDQLKDSSQFGFNKANRLVSGNILSSIHFILRGINSEQADDFCWKVANGENLTKDNPIYLLRQKLLNDIRSTRKMSKVERLALICKAWNLFRGGKKISILKWDSVRESFPKPL